MGAIFHQAGFAINLEAPCIFHGKVPSPDINAYTVMHTTRDSIIPDLLMHNFPSDLNGNGAWSMEAIFDIKTLWIDKNVQLYANRRTGTSHTSTNMKATKVQKGYQRQAVKLDMTRTWWWYVPVFQRSLQPLQLGWRPPSSLWSVWGNTSGNIASHYVLYLLRYGLPGEWQGDPAQHHHTTRHRSTGAVELIPLRH